MKYIRLILIFGIIGLLSSCESNLDTSPTNMADEEVVFKTADNIETIINGTWAKFNDDGTTYANIGYSTVLRTSDAMGSDVAVLTNKYGFAGAYTFTDLINSTGGRAEFFWNLFYSTINNMNKVIDRIDQSEGTQEKKNQVKGQALAFRAFCYLNLASFYQFSYLKDKTALAVPIYTEPTNTGTKPNKRAALEEIYSLIQSDLLKANVLLKGYEKNNKEKFDTAVVQGLLARTYLNIGEWDKAAEAASLAKANYTLMPAENYKSGFNDINNPEWIWGHGQTQAQSSESYSFHFLDVSSPSSFYYSFMADPHFKELFDQNDIRYQLFEWGGEKSKEGLLMYKKFKFKTGRIADIVYMRSAEMYLIEAEGKAKSGQLADAVSILNELKAARNANLYTGELNQNSVVKEILIERRKELFGEGFSLSDILRTQGTVVRKPYLDSQGNSIYVNVITSDGTTKRVEAKGHTVFSFPDEGKSDFTPNSRYYLFSIPQKEIENNPNL